MEAELFVVGLLEINILILYHVRSLDFAISDPDKMI